jgi:decaprenyl-phosphate phosphoribosyltransferase
MNKIRSLIKLMRPKHYIKNLLIFVSIFFDRNIFAGSILAKVICGFVAFCVISSAIYIFNDIHDVEQDRRHEVKKNRPIASGAISVKLAYIIAFGLFILAVAINWFCGFGWQAMTIMLVYFVCNLGYSLGLKNIPFLDIVLLVMGFMLRVLYGAAIIGSGVSAWVYLTVISLSFYLGLGKRRNELKKSKGETSTRKVLSFYSFEFLDKFMYLCLTLAVAFYALWSADAEIEVKYGTDKLIWTVPLVIVLLMKYSADIESNSYGDPVDVITHDKVLVLLSFIFALVLFGLIYIPGLR